MHKSAYLKTELRGMFLDRVGSKRVSGLSVINDILQYFEKLECSRRCNG